ncbi:hypothetical protein niasHT_027520 [Heterodera trifolii]|uniref:G-protein coupled receptors family 1 profile domain-containing protein n=1 Tax=Heterodera trifolii TaxID=157864 RepID=A0ABD2K5F8_9BILA
MANFSFSAYSPPIVSCTGKKALTDSAFARPLFLIAYLSLFFVGFVGNFLVVWVVATCKNMQTVTNVFIANLAVSDLFVCCTSIWLTPSYTFIGHWIWGAWMCYALPLFQGASIFISSLTLTAIALDRHWVICRSQPRTHASTSNEVCAAVICLIWCLSLLLVLPYGVHMRIAQVMWPCRFSLCVEDWGGKEDMRSLYGVTTVVLQFVVPFAVIGHSYRRIWHFMEARRMRRHGESDAQMARKRRLLSMLVRMVLLFGICWLPFNFLNLLRDLRADAFLKPYFSFLFLLAHLLSMVVPAANPLLYAWMNASFRDAFLSVLPFRKWHKNAISMKRKTTEGKANGVGERDEGEKRGEDKAKGQTEEKCRGGTDKRSAITQSFRFPLHASPRPLLRRRSSGDRMVP